MAGKYIGQHSSTTGVGGDSGQRTRTSPGARVGNLSGGENNMNVPPSRPNADIDTAVGVERGPNDPARR